MMNRRNMLSVLAGTSIMPAFGHAQRTNLPVPVPNLATASIPAEEALRFIQRVADATTWWDKVLYDCEREGITDPEEIEAALHAHQNDMDDLIYAEEDLCDLVSAARELLGRNRDNEVIDVEVTEIVT